MTRKDITLANPQGKASIALLDDLNTFKFNKAKEKNIPEWLADYFTSLLVLSASFNFKPIFNKTYYLYLNDQQWKLSLIEPQAWSNCPYVYFAECCMHEDRTWSIQPTINWQENTYVSKHIKAMKQEFYKTLSSQSSIIDSLPYFAKQLPYYRRLSAFGLANSLKDSLQLKLGAENTRKLKGRELLDKVKNNNLLKLSN